MGDRTSQEIPRAVGRSQELGRFVAASLILGASLELTGRLLVYGPGVSYNVSRVFTLFALLVFGGSMWYVLRQVYSSPRLSAVVLLGTGLVVFSQTYGVIASLIFHGETGGPQSGPVWLETLHAVLEEGTFVAGVGLLLGSFYLSILETEKTKAHLAAERQELVREVAERKRAEDSLRDAYAATEHRVAERTASLTEANQRLQAEIAERQRAEEALRESEQLHRILAEDAYDGICIIQDGKLVSVNPELCAILGYSVEEMLHTPFTAMLHPETAEEASRMFESFMHGMKLPGAYETALLHRDGSRIAAEISGTLIMHQGAEAGLITLRDITERVKAEQALKKSELRYRSLVDDGGDIVWRIDRQGRFTFVNSAVKSLGDFEPEELLGQPFEIVMDKESGKRARQTLQERLAGKIGTKSISIEVISRKKDGSLLPSEIVSTPIFDPDGNLFEIQGVTRDITERKHAEAALRESEEKYRTLFESSHDALMILEPPKWKCTSANPATVKMFRAHSAEEITSCVRWALSPARQPDGRASSEKGEEMIETAVREGSHSFEWMHTRLDGEEFPASVLLAKIEQAGKVFVQATIRDITGLRRAEEERDKLEAQLRQAQKMEGIGQLAGGVAHDFNNLMAVVLGYTEMVLGLLPPDDPCRNMLTQVGKAGERAATLTRQLLAFSRKQVLKPEPVDLNTVAAELVKMIHRVIGEHIVLTVVHGHELAEVYADRGQIEQVLMNLCVNARDAMPDGGHLTIETENVLLDTDYVAAHPGAAPGPYVLLSVTDSGCGMDSKTMQQIFEPFFTTKEKGRGTGLGLATVYGIVHQHEGIIEVDSKPGKGTTFKVYLPVFEQVGEPIDRQAPEPIRGGNETILLAEDDEQIRQLAQVILEDAGYSVYEAEDGEDALRLYQERGGAFDLLILDVVMPKKGGRTVLDEIRMQRPEMRCLFASGYSEDAIHTNFILERGLRLLEKPYQRDSLLRAVRETLDT